MSASPRAAAAAGYAASGEAPVRTTAERALVPALLLLLVLLAGALVVANPTEAIWDQQALLASRFERPIYPSPARGFTSQLIVATWHALSPFSEAGLNEQVKVLALALYAGAATLLASALLARPGIVVAFLALLFTSQYPLLWLSSELFTGAFLCLALWAWVTARPPWLTGLLLALLGLAKPDVILVSAALLAWFVWQRSSREEGIALVASTGGFLALLLAPGVLVDGVAYFSTYNGEPGGRSFASFRQHYAALVAPLQVLGRPPNPWTESAVYFDRAFPGAATMGDVVTHHFPRYLEFVALSCVRGVLRAGWVLNYAALAIPFLLVAAWRSEAAGRFLTNHDRTLLVAFVGVAPFVLLSFPHVRYLARYYPLFLVLVLGALQRLHERGDPAARSALGLAVLCLALSLLENTGRLAKTVVAAPELQQFWFPD